MEFRINSVTSETPAIPGFFLAGNGGRFLGNETFEYCMDVLYICLWMVAHAAPPLSKKVEPPPSFVPAGVVLFGL